MIGIAIVLGGLIAHQFEAMIVKRYGAKHGKGGMFFNAILYLAATVYFFATATSIRGENGSRSTSTP